MQTQMAERFTHLALMLLFTSIQFFCNSQNPKSQVMDTVKEKPSVINTSSDNITAIRDLEDRFVSAVNSGDVDGIMKCYVPGKSFHVFDIVPRKAYYGADNYRKAWEDFYTHYKGIPRMTLFDLQITAEGNLAFGHCLTNIKGADSNGNPLDRMVRVSAGYRKIDGKWLKAHEHISVPVDFKTGKLVPVPKP
jgi:ketosteroid isomerase-like protein